MTKKSKSAKLEAMRLAAVRLTKEKGGKGLAVILPHHTKAEIAAHTIWKRHHAALVALSNQIHEGIEPTAEWDDFHAHCQGCGSNLKPEARDILAALETAGTEA